MSAFSTGWLDYFKAHAIKSGVASETGVREEGGDLVFPYPGFERRRPLGGYARQPSNTPLAAWWPAGVPKSSKAGVGTEGEGDGLAAESAIKGTQLEYEFAVACLPGASCPPERLVEDCRRFGLTEMYLALDADEAGRRATTKLAAALLKANIAVYLIELPDGKDLADCLSSAHDPTTWLMSQLSNAAEAETEAESVGDGMVAIAASAVEKEKVEWLWPGRIPIGGVSLIVGDPGLGKSVLTCMLAADVSSWGQTVLMATAEDSLGATMRPRLEAAGADLGRVNFIQMKRDGIAEGIAVPDDVDELRRLAIEHKAKLIVIDPLTAHFGVGIDGFKDQSVRKALAPLHHLAEELGCAIVVVAHLNKGSSSDAIKRVGGSIGTVGAARSVLLLAREPSEGDEDNGRRVLAHVKSNLSKQAPSLLYEIEPIQLGEIQTLRLNEIGECNLNGDDLLETRTGDERGVLAEAEDFLRSLFADIDELSALDVKRESQALQISGTTLSRAKRALGIESERRGGVGKDGAWWCLVPKDGLPTKKPTPSPAKKPEPGGFLGDEALDSEKHPLNSVPDSLRNQSSERGFLGTTDEQEIIPYDQLSPEDQRKVDEAEAAA